MAQPAQKKTLLELIDDVDSLPHDFDFNTLYKLILPADPRPHGHLFPSTVSLLPWSSFPDIVVDHEARTITLTCAPSAATVTATLQTLVDYMVDNDTMGITRKLHSEPFRICGAVYDGVCPSIERYPVPLFGTSSRGAHMTCFVRDDHAPHGIRIWVAKRSKTIMTYPSLWDTTVAGGVKAGDTPFDCVAVEAMEEACIPEAEVRRRAWCASIVTYMSGHRDADGNLYRASPSVVYCFDMELKKDEIPRPGDDEVERFELWTVDECMEVMQKSGFKPNCNLVMIDFFVRWGVITPESEGYVEMVTRLRRRLPVPMDPLPIK